MDKDRLRLAQHTVFVLARTLGTRITYDQANRWDSRSEYDPHGPGHIRVSPVSDEQTYAIALHELGHVACSHHHARADEDRVLREEATAWEWAVANARPEFTEKEWAAMEAGLGSYLSNPRFFAYGKEMEQGAMAARVLLTKAALHRKAAT